MVELSQQQALEIMRLIGIGGSVVVTPIKRYNHVYRIECGGAAFFLKTYTKDWLGDPCRPRPGRARGGARPP
jgi:hypothetical protein